MSIKGDGSIQPAEVSAAPEDSIQFGSILKAARKRKGLSQDELSSLMGVNRNTILNWESNRNKPDVDMLFHLCRVLDLTIHDLFPGEDRLSRLERSMLRNFRALKPETQELVHTMIHAMLDREQSVHAEALRESFKVVTLVPGSLAAGVAGGGSPFLDEQASPFFLRINDRTARADAVIRVSGHSMEPVYHDGDYVYFQHVSSACPGEDVVVAWAGEQYVKRMDGRRKLYSINPDYPFEYDGEGDDIHVLGRVLGIVSTADRAYQEDLPLLEDLFENELRAFRSYN